MAKAYGAKIFASSSGLSRSQIQPLLEEWAAEDTVLESDVVATLTGHRSNPFLLAEMSVADVLARLKSALENHKVVCLNTEADTPCAGYQGRLPYKACFHSAWIDNGKRSGRKRPP